MSKIDMMHAGMNHFDCSPPIIKRIEGRSSMTTNSFSFRFFLLRVGRRLPPLVLFRTSPSSVVLRRTGRGRFRLAAEPFSSSVRTRRLPTFVLFRSAPSSAFFRPTGRDRLGLVIESFSSSVGISQPPWKHVRSDYGSNEDDEW